MPVVVVRTSPVVQVIENTSSTEVLRDPSTQVAVLRDPSTVVELNARGPMGPIGPAGPASDGTIAPISFSYGDAPGVVFTPSEDGTLTYARVVFETAFDGASPAFKLGTLADDDCVMATHQNDPLEVGEYEVTADAPLVAGQSVYIAITPGAGASQGAGLIYLTFIPD
jgi:hypothetical protein